jgi:lipopolysaccharide biosynthesis protein
MYLPQYHPIPENDAWWGTGFTEWTNVVKARSLFRGHNQPNLPADLGFYDLRLPEMRIAQAAMARQYGVYGFCYYHYWFNGRRVLERPFTEVLSSGAPDFPFCLCWANENWTRVWDGGTNDILLKQEYCHEDDLEHIKSLLPAFRDERYIRINGKPLFLVYRTEHLPNPLRTAEIWREFAWKSGVGEIYLVRVESFVSGIDPGTIGFDAAMEFSPDWKILKVSRRRNILHRLLMKAGLCNRVYLDNIVCEYEQLIERMLGKEPPGFKRFRCVTPNFDNSPRRKRKAAIFRGSTPDKFMGWLKQAVEMTMREHVGDERVLFINGWNEWGESNYLEPDTRWGRAYLEAVAKVMNNG